MPDQLSIGSNLSLVASKLSAQEKPGKKDFEKTDLEKTKQACSEFESIFLYQMLKQMRATVPKTDLMGDSKSREVYQDMMDMEVSKNLASSGGIGLAAMMFQQLQEQNALKSGGRDSTEAYTANEMTVPPSQKKD